MSTKTTLIIYNTDSNAYAGKFIEFQHSISDDFLVYGEPIENLDYIKMEIDINKTTIREIIDHLVQTLQTDQIIFRIRKHCTVPVEQRHSMKYQNDYLFGPDDHFKTLSEFPILQTEGVFSDRPSDIQNKPIILGYMETDWYSDIVEDMEPEELEELGGHVSIYNQNLHDEEYYWLEPHHSYDEEKKRIKELLHDIENGCRFYFEYQSNPKRLVIPRKIN